MIIKFLWRKGIKNASNNKNYSPVIIIDANTQLLEAIPSTAERSHFYYWGATNIRKKQKL